MVLACPSCGKKNRVSATHLTGQVRCGACQTALTPVSHPIDADAETFEDILRHASVPVLVDFWAEWCGPCRRAAPEVKRVAADLAGRALVVKIDTERQPDLATRYRAFSIPNFLILKDGQVVRQQPGLVDHRQLQAWLEAAGA